ncbi:MAG: hypothetical protein ACREHG_07025 [Candidatus Saccharimonadales bacterium]
MQKLAKGSITLISGLIGSWIGAAIAHGNWWGWWSNILGIVGLIAGYYVVHLINNYIDG